MPDRYDDLSEYNWLMAQVLLHETDQALALGRLLYDRLLPGSVLDVGCGPGIYLSYFREQGCTILGIDGAPAGGECLGPGEFEIVDLRTAWRPLRTYDLVLCIEVAEHLKPEFADNLVRIVANSGNTIYFCAARPGQGGESHWNEQPQSYWLEKFFKYGVAKHRLNDEFQAAINVDPVYEHCMWLRTNGMLLG